MRFSERPIIAGLTALAAVSLGLGLLLGIGAVVASWGLGLGDSGSTEAAVSSSETMYLPKPEPTDDEVGPLVSLQPEPSSTESGPPASALVLVAAQTAVASMQQIDLTGTYPGKDGAILQVQRFQSGAWQDFPATPMTVNGGSFSTYIQTGQVGENRFRVVDTDDQTPSNEIVVTITG